MMKVFLTVATCLGLAQFASAAPEASEPKWSDFFDGDENQVGIDWEKPWPNSSDWRGSGKPLPFKSWIRGATVCPAEIDQVLAAIADYDRAYRAGDDKNARKIFRELQLSIGGVRPECVKAAERALWVAAVLLGPDEKLVREKNNIVFMTLFLANQDVFSYLTPEMRKGLAKGRKSIWTDKQGGDYLLSGVYSCQDGKVYLSSSLRPYNLFASLLHELDHLYRDKIGYEAMKTWRDTLDIKSFLVTDELRATLYGAFYQANFRMDIGSGVVFGDELNMFKQGGPLSKLVAFTHKWPPYSFTFFLGAVTHVEEPHLTRLRAHLCAMDQVIRTGYFGRVNGPCNLGYLFPEAAYITFENYSWSLGEMRRDPARRMELLKELQEIAQRLKETTPPCQKMLEAQAKGELDHYIGSRIKGAPSRPGNAGIKPCLRIAL